MSVGTETMLNSDPQKTRHTVIMTTQHSVLSTYSSVSTVVGDSNKHRTTVTHAVNCIEDSSKDNYKRSAKQH